MINTERSIGIHDFYNELQIIADYFEWKTNPSIRGFKHNRLFCPITAVAYALHGKYFRANRWKEAAKHIGLSYYVADTITQASDFGVSFNSELECCYNTLLENLK
jgi:hypothetical protein